VIGAGSTKRKLRLLALVLAGVLEISLVLGCTRNAGQAAVTLRLSAPRGTPRDASVIIDEEYIGPLWYVAARGVRLPVGEHRITVEKSGYFPWDRLVVSDRQPIKLDVELVPVPD
jgi:hypothetical protein